MALKLRGMAHPVKTRKQHREKALVTLGIWEECSGEEGGDAGSERIMGREGAAEGANRSLGMR
jgi:hypothetical protein